jgi:hypothetical protein
MKLKEFVKWYAMANDWEDGLDAIADENLDDLLSDDIYEKYERNKYDEVDVKCTKASQGYKLKVSVDGKKLFTLKSNESFGI